MSSPLRRVLTALAATLSLAIPAQGATLTLTGTIRDFLDTDAGFEIDPGGLETGAVEAALDSDGKPVLSPGASAQFPSAAEFATWYRKDDPDLDDTLSLDIDLSETAPGSGVFRYEGDPFFPIDGLLLGNQGRAHNYHFTYELRGTLDLIAGAQFDFTGDDDLWVFVDERLALDIGGIKSPRSGSFTSADLVDDLGLVLGERYDFAVFFAERRTRQSTFIVETSFVLETPAAVIPLPAGLWLLGSGAAGLALLRLGRKSPRAA